MAKKSKILEAVHETAATLHEAGAISETTMRKFDKLCLPPVTPLKPADIKHIRESAHISQAVFAAYLNTSVSTVQKWEIGNKKPSGIALRLLRVVQKRGLKVLI